VVTFPVLQSPTIFLFGVWGGVFLRCCPQLFLPTCGAEGEYRVNSQVSPLLKVYKITGGLTKQRTAYGSSLLSCLRIERNVANKEEGVGGCSVNTLAEGLALAAGVTFPNDWVAPQMKGRRNSQRVETDPERRSVRMSFKTTRGPVSRKKLRVGLKRSLHIERDSRGKIQVEKGVFFW